MKALVFDTSALLALFFDEPGAAAVEALMHRAAERDQPMLMSAVNWAEVCYRVKNKRGAEALARAKEFAANAPVGVVAADRDIAEAAAVFKSADLLGLVDAFAAALTKTLKAELVTADREFKSVEGEIKLVWLKNQ